MTEQAPEKTEAAGGEGELLPAFADLVIGISRLLVGLGGLAPFRNAEFSMADWVALSVLAKGPPKNNRQLAKALGVTRQRANQIKASLERARLISATQSTEDARQKVLTLTSRGHARLKEVDAQLQATLVLSFANKGRVLVRANKAVRMVMRGIRAAGDKTKNAEQPIHKKARRRLRKMSRIDA